MHYNNVELLARYAGHSDAIYSIEHGFKTGSFMSAGGDCQVVEWDYGNTDKARVIAKTLSSVYILNKIAESGLLLIGTNGGELSLIDYESKRLVSELNLKATLFDSYLSGHDTLFVTASDGWVFQLSFPQLQVIRRHKLGENHVRRIVSTSDGMLLCSDSKGDLWLYGTKKEAFTLWTEAAHQDSIFSLFAGKNSILSGGKDAMLKSWVWSAENPLISVNEVPAHLFTINDIKPIGDFIVTASRDKTIKLWTYPDLMLKKVIDREKFKDGHTHSVNRLLVKPNTNEVLSAGDDRIIRHWRFS